MSIYAAINFSFEAAALSDMHKFMIDDIYDHGYFREYEYNNISDDGFKYYSTEIVKYVVNMHSTGTVAHVIKFVLSDHNILLHNQASLIDGVIAPNMLDFAKNIDKCHKLDLPHYTINLIDYNTFEMYKLLMQCINDVNSKLKLTYGSQFEI